MVPGGIDAVIGDVAPWPDWAAAAAGALRFPARARGLGRLDGHPRRPAGAQVVLCASPGTAPSAPAPQLPWEESFCRAMTEGRAPRVATVTAAVPEYAALTKGLGADVAAYLGVPLVAPDGELFGTVCGVAFRAQAAERRRATCPLVEMVARMLSTLLAAGMEPPPLADPGLTTSRIRRATRPARRACPRGAA